MAKRQKLDEAGDNDELQALFDSIAENASKPKLEVVAGSGPDDTGDSNELQALFDSVVASATAMSLPGADAGVAMTTDAMTEAEAMEALPAAPQSPEERQEHVFNKIGQLTRLLHDTLRELGYDRMLAETAQQLPDARQRLAYISQMTEQAASRVLNATDIAKPLQDRVQERATALSGSWEKLYAKQLTLAEFKTLAGETRGFLSQVSEDSKVVNEQLLEIMMAQDFQDLTGQVIKKIVDMAQTLEGELLKVLLEVIPENRRSGANEGLLNGPVVNAQGRDDVVTNQEQVDDLLESLGF